MSALLLSPVVLTACSAGQIAQTEEQNRDKVGAQVDVGDIALRAVELPYPVGGVYPSGSDARLVAGIANAAATDDTLVSIESDSFDSVEVVDPTATEDAAAGAAGSSLDVTVPAASTLFLGNGTGPAVTLVGLAEDLGVGQFIDITFTFESAGEVTVPVPVGVAARDLPRGEAFDFEPEEEREQTGGGPS